VEVDPGPASITTVAQRSIKVDVYHPRGFKRSQHYSVSSPHV
jgi:hypothetical protein